MSVWDLSTRENWELILSERRVAQRIPNSSSAQYEYKYIPISPIYTNPNSHTLLVGTYSETALPYWFLGARASQYLYVSPSDDYRFISGVQASDIKRVGLNRLTLIKFEDYGVLPYVLQLEIPYWLEDIYVEVWEYQDIITSEVEQKLLDIESILSDITADLEDIKRRLN